MKRYRVYHPAGAGGAMRLAAVVRAASKDGAIRAAADKRKLTGHHAHLFSLVARVEVIRCAPGSMADDHTV